MMSWDWNDVWHKSRQNWHWPLLPAPRLGMSEKAGEFPFRNYQINLDRQTLALGPVYLENLFDHLIVHYIFCPRSLEEASLLALAALKGLEKPEINRAHSLVNIFTDIVVDSFRLERSSADEKKVLMGWKRLADQNEQGVLWGNGANDENGEKGRTGEKARTLTPLDRVILGFLRNYWGAALPSCSRPEVDLLGRIFSPGIRDKSLWPRQCRQMTKILEPFLPGILGSGQIRCLEILNGSANNAPLKYAAGLDSGQYEKVLAVLGMKGDLKRWYRDQSYCIEIRETLHSKSESYPSAPVKWRLTDPCSELDYAYSLSLAPLLIPGVSTYKRGRETGRLAPGYDAVPDLLVVLDSSRSMEGPTMGTKTHKATLAAFKACWFAHSKGAEIAAINFSEKYLALPWTRDLNAVEDVLVEFFCTRTHIPGKAIRELAEKRPGCLILCITDTHIQNLYQEWDDIKKASEKGKFVLFCIDQACRDKHVEETLASLGQVYYINRLEDLVSLVVDVTGRAYSGESFISLQ
ncbi:MAG: VWA domain-containing protein [Methanothrix sp.]|nr:VWA domain-containing protein [Methanothrix sp.]